MINKLFALLSKSREVLNNFFNRMGIPPIIGWIIFAVIVVAICKAAIWLFMKFFWIALAFVIVAGGYYGGDKLHTFLKKRI